MQKLTPIKQSIMKKSFLFAVACAMSLTTFAQWNNTGDSKTTGSLTLGDGNSPYTSLTITSKTAYKESDMASPLYQMGDKDSGKRDIIFRAVDDNGTAVIRSYTGGGYGGGLVFLTGIENWKLKPRININAGGWTELFDERVSLGSEKNAAFNKQGTRLEFCGTPTDSSSPHYIAKYARSQYASDFRVGMGLSNEDRFIVGIGGTYGHAFNSLFIVSGNGNVGIGLGDKDAQNKLEVNGTIRAKEVRVESGWADFVFQKDYQLPTLQEVKAHIDEHKHLPGMPSEAEVKENGVGLADATTRLLQKVEELTLYAIQQQEKIEALSNQINELKNEKK